MLCLKSIGSTHRKLNLTPPLALMECLERRTLLNATLTSSIPAISTAPGGVTTINLATDFNDPSVPGTLVDVTTPLGVIPIALTDSKTPNTVSNFLKYVNGGEYNGTIFHRLVSGFVLQGGGYSTDGSAVPNFGPIAAEPGQSNSIYSVAMALSTGPDSGVNQWYINLGDNSSLLDNSSDGGPFTVFGHIVYGGISVVDSIASLRVVDDASQNFAWDTLPVLSGYTGPSTVTSVSAADMVTTNYQVVQPLTYTATSDDPSLVVPTIDGGKLTLNFGSTPGTTSVHVTATDAGGNAASASFTISTLPPPAVVRVSAPTVTAPTATSEPVTVTYSDSKLDLDASSINPDNISVTDPTGVGLSVIDAQASSTSSVSITVVYTVAAPVTTWGASSPGTYTITLGAKPVGDLSGSHVASLNFSFVVTPHALMNGLSVGQPSLKLPQSNSRTSMTRGGTVALSNVDAAPIKGLATVSIYAWNAANGSNPGTLLRRFTSRVRLGAGTRQRFKSDDQFKVFPPPTGGGASGAILRIPNFALHGLSGSYFLLATASLGKASGTSPVVGPVIL